MIHGRRGRGAAPPPSIRWACAVSAAWNAVVTHTLVGSRRVHPCRSLSALFGLDPGQVSTASYIRTDEIQRCIASVFSGTHGLPDQLLQQNLSNHTPQSDSDSSTTGLKLPSSVQK